MDDGVQNRDDRPFMSFGHGGLTEEEAAFLYGLAISLRPRIIAEIGTGCCRSLRAFDDARRWMEAKLDWNCSIYTCDIHPTPCREARHMFPEAHVVDGNARQMIAEMCDKHRVELMFIDGEHTYDAAMSDYKAMSAMTDSCTFVFHDANLFPEIGDLVLELGGHILRTPRGIGIVTTGERQD